MDGTPQPGLLMLGNAGPDRLIQVAQLAERSGFGQIWLADERFYREVYSYLSVFALNTKSILLGPCVTDPYSRHPAMTAAAMATLDELSGGRALLGFGTGLSGFAAMGVVREKPVRAMAEALDIIRQLLTGETIDYKGEILSFRNGKLNFTPPRRDIPVYIASNGTLGQALGGRVAQGVIMEGCGTPREAAAFIARVKAAATKIGRDPSAVKCIARLNCCISKNAAAAHDLLRLRTAKTLAGSYMPFHTHAEDGIAMPAEITAKFADVRWSDNAPYEAILSLIEDSHVDAVTLAGTAEQVTKRVSDLLAAGIDNVIISPMATDGETTDEIIRAFGEEIWPKLMREHR
jgi:5,10-methylenetetrahydromethanopterin reductase